MFPNNPNIIEKLVQLKQEEIEREVRGFNEQQVWNSNDPGKRSSTSSQMVRVVGVLAALAGLISLLG